VAKTLFGVNKVPRTLVHDVHRTVFH